MEVYQSFQKARERNRENGIVLSLLEAIQKALFSLWKPVYLSQFFLEQQGL
jgi:hypothetical protein